MSLAIVGGSGFSKIDAFECSCTHDLKTPYGKPSAAIQEGQFFFHPVFFLARHGLEHSILPHKINYRANIHALKQLGVTKIIALAAVGGIADDCEPGSLIIPDQLIDYTYGREVTFYDEIGNVAHAEFTEPYSHAMREQLILSAKNVSIDIVPAGIYAVTQGPRFETAAEIAKLKNDGASIVGMTAMPEAVLARELGIAYVTIALSVNYAAGIKPGFIEHDDIHVAYAAAANKLYAVLSDCIEDLLTVETDIPELIRP